MSKYDKIECKENEIFLFNMHEDDFEVKTKGIWKELKTIRLGNTAYGLDGSNLKEDYPDLKPVFIDKSEDKLLDKIQNEEFKRINNRFR